MVIQWNKNCMVCPKVFKRGVCMSCATHIKEMHGWRKIDLLSRGTSERRKPNSVRIATAPKTL